MHLGRLKTEPPSLQQQHLCIQAHSPLPSMPISPSFHQPHPDSHLELQTNFGISVTNPFCFIVLHFRSKNSKNVLNVMFPDICIFHDRMPYDIISSSKGTTKWLRTTETAKIRLRDVNKIFRENWGSRVQKNQLVSVVFSNDDVLVISDSDLHMVCCKNKNDPFFKRIQYIQNKMPANNNTPILVHFSNLYIQERLKKIAMECLMNLKKQLDAKAEIQSFCQNEQQKEDTYLQFLNIKIVQFLNYEHNIKIIQCTFTYIKTNQGLYYLVNANNLQFTNLTHAVQNRQRRLAEKQEQRYKILIMTPEKQVRYKSFETKKHVQTYEHTMNRQFHDIVQRMNMHCFSNNKRQQLKNQLAFKKLHPKSRFTYTQIISSPNFNETKNIVLENVKRKPITTPSRYVMRYYNRIRNNRVKTEMTETTD